MVSEKKSAVDSEQTGNFLVEGQIQREQPECQPGEMRLSAHVFDRSGTLLGSGELDGKGKYVVAVRLSAPAAVELVVGPVGEAQELRHSSAYRKMFAAEEWKGDGKRYRLEHSAVLPLDIWRPWWPLRICVSGHVRKISHHDGGPTICPVPHVKVEIFDVDREACWWPLLRKWWKLLLDRPVIRLPDLIKEPPFPLEPFPGPDPLPELKLAGDSPVQEMVWNSPLEKVAINPQPEPPGYAANQAAFLRVGESRMMDSTLASRLDRLTLTSKIAPWIIRPLCFYSRKEVCETTTDCDGYFNCCFKWWPFHFRRGRLRFDLRPDIIVRVTQTIGGVSTVIYMDPYTSTRWNVNHAHIDLFLDNEEVLCGSGCRPIPPGKAAYLTLVGHDEVYKINQETGAFSNTGYGGVMANWAYGHWLLICGLFGEGLAGGIPKRYYRLSYKKGLANATDPDDNAGFIPITTPLSDTRVDKLTYDTQVIHIGPQPPVNGVPNLYEIRNTNDYMWYNQDKLVWWDTTPLHDEAGIYTLRLEVFNEQGVKLTSAAVDYRDGTCPPPGPLAAMTSRCPGPLPAMTNRCDLVILIDNSPPEFTLSVPGAGPECGVVPFSAVPGLTVAMTVNQAHGHLQEWTLSYVKGVTGGSGLLVPTDHNDAGILPLPVSRLVPAGAMTAGLTSTCAFSLTLEAWPLIRNGIDRIYHDHKTIAIAVEKCPPCP